MNTRKPLLVLLSTLVLLAASLYFAPTTAAVVPCGGGPRVVVYEDANYGGSWKYFCGYTNVPDLLSVGFPGFCTSQPGFSYGTWNDCISSYKAYSITGHYLCFYTEPNYGGAHEGYINGGFIPNVTYNDAYSSIRWRTLAAGPC